MKPTGPRKTVRMRIAREEGLQFPEPFFWTTSGIERLRRRDPRYRRQLHARALDALNSPRTSKLAAEGDSWFDHPCVSEVMDWIEDAGYAVYRSDAPGRLLATMLSEKAYLNFLDDPSVRAVLLSGGGNDLISWKRTSNKVASPIFRRGNGSSKPADYLDLAELDKALALIGRLLAQFALDVRKKRPGIPIITHCYDWFEPRTTGPFGAWIGPQMDLVGVPQSLRKDVAVLLINQANDAYERTCADSRMTFVDLRGTTRGRWYDEIHPDGDAFKEIAAKLIATIPGRKTRRRARE